MVDPPSKKKKKKKVAALTFRAFLSSQRVYSVPRDVYTSSRVRPITRPRNAKCDQPFKFPTNHLLLMPGIQRASVAWGRFSLLLIDSASPTDPQLVPSPVFADRSPPVRPQGIFVVFLFRGLYHRESQRTDDGAG